jgi:hypothetical protein
MTEQTLTTADKTAKLEELRPEAFRPETIAP